MGMNRLNSHFLLPSPTAPERLWWRPESSGCQVRSYPSRSRLLTGSHRYSPGRVQQDQGHRAETAVLPYHNNQSTIYKDVGKWQCQIWRIWWTVKLRSSGNDVEHFHVLPGYMVHSFIPCECTTCSMDATFSNTCYILQPFNPTSTQGRKQVQHMWF
jgi:hypothetical protein